jgi:hypothetical protein
LAVGGATVRLYETAAEDEDEEEEDDVNVCNEEV